MTNDVFYESYPKLFKIVPCGRGGQCTLASIRFSPFSKKPLALAVVNDAADFSIHGVTRLNDIQTCN